MSFHHNNEPIPGVHPFIGFLVSLTFLIAGKYMDSLTLMVELATPQSAMRVPPFMIDVLMCLAYSGTFLVGGITAYKFFKDISEPKKPKRK